MAGRRGVEDRGRYNIVTNCVLYVSYEPEKASDYFMLIFIRIFSGILRAVKKLFPAMNA